MGTSGKFELTGVIATQKLSWADEGLHQHATMEITIMLEGKGVYEDLQGRQMLESGDIVIVPSERMHRYEGVQYNRLAVMHASGIPARLVPLLGRLVPAGDVGRASLSRLDKERFERLFREWLRTLSMQLKERERSNTAWLEILLLFIIEHSRTDKQALSISRAADYIRENLQQGVQISALAGLAGLTESAFRRNFEQAFQMGPKQYQQQCRMAEAKWLLSASEKEIQEIAEQIGFSRIHSFSQWFKKEEGVAPSEWRRLQRDNY